MSSRIDRQWQIPRYSRRMLLVVGGFVAVKFLEGKIFWQEKEVAIAKDHPLWNSQVRIYTKSNYRYIVANGLPNHETGSFPNPRNPNSIKAQSYQFRVPANPRIAERIAARKLGRFGVAVNGVLFNPGAAEYWRGDRNWQYEALSGKIDLGMDANHAHVQPNGAYHYHGLPVGLVAKLGNGKEMLLIGYAADGFPIYTPYGYSEPRNPRSPMRQIRSSYRLKKGKRDSGSGGRYDGTFFQDYEYVAGAGDLDECNGRFGVTPEYPKGIYHYYITQEFPFISRYFRGTPDDSFRPQEGGQRPMGGQNRPRPGSMPPPPGFPPDRPPPPDRLPPFPR
ncbi:YHYH protein [Merismopedia glauca]|nr:YHYH protein [Merismopedia glauca]